MPSPSILRLSVALLTGSVVLACAFNPRSACETPVSNGVRLAVDRRKDNPLIADARVDLDVPAPVYLEYGNEQVGWLRTPTTAVGATHQVPILRLRKNANYRVHAFAVDASGCPEATSRAEFTTGELPAQFGKLSVEVSGGSSYPLTVTDVRLSDNDRRDRSELRAFVAFDQEGHIVWYYPLSEQTLRGSRRPNLYSLVRLESGNFVYVVKNLGIEEISPDGRLIRRISLEAERPHHDLVDLRDGRALVLGAEYRVIDDTRNGGLPNQRVRGDTINVVDLESGARQRVWSTFDALDPADRPHGYRKRDEDSSDAIDWTHSNSLHVGSRGNVLVSIRWLDQVVSLSPDLQTVEWKLGGSGSAFSFPDPSDQFYAQHSAEELPDGRILLFDNGNNRPDGDYSRALELQLDVPTMTAHKVWEYRHQPDQFASMLSNASRLANGNTLVNFGFPADPDDAVRVVEARPDGAAASILSVRVKGEHHGSYRAYALASLAGEVSVERVGLGPR
jgi:hypothetical protein